MSYIVKGAEMPRKCEDCIFLSFHGAGDYPYCIVTGTKKDCTFIPKLETERMDSCPLVEIPPHGRLIDENDVLKSAEELRKSPWYNDEPYRAIRKDGFEIAIDMTVKDAPTVIEAEGVKE